MRVMRAAHSSAHGGSNDNDENHDDDPNDSLPSPVPRHPLLDGLVLVRRYRVFFTGIAHSTGAVVEDGTVLVRWCYAVSRGGGCAAIGAWLE